MYTYKAASMYMVKSMHTHPQSGGWCWSLTRDIAAAEVVSELLAAFQVSKV